MNILVVGDEDRIAHCRRVLKPFDTFECLLYNPRGVVKLNDVQRPLISVVVPIYKVERYIKQCLESVLNQTLGDFELILVDDCSPDHSVDICQQFAQADPRISVVRHDHNQGLGAARNTGLEHVHGKYVFFLDSDDMIFDNAFEIFYRTAEANDADIVHCSSMLERFDDGTVKVTKDKSPFDGFLPFERNRRLKSCYVDKNIWPMVWLNFYRRDFLERYNIKFPCILSEDEPFSIALYCWAERFYCIPDYLYVYNRRANSISKANDVERTVKGVRSMLDGWNYLIRLFERVPHDVVSPQIQNDCIQAFFESMIQGYILCLYDSSEAVESAGAFETLRQAIGERGAIDERLAAHLLQGFCIQKSLNNLIARSLMSENRQLRLMLDTLGAALPSMMSILRALQSTSKRVLLMSVPVHGNLGDQAITVGEQFVLKKIFPKHEIVEIPTPYLSGYLGETFSSLGFERSVRPTDLIFIHGGGNLGTLWGNEERVHQRLIARFSRNRIIILPQSIFFDRTTQEELTRASVEIYNGHRDLHLVCRDEVSFAVAAELFPRVKRYLAPDSVTMLMGTWDGREQPRDGVLFVLRHDKERFDHTALIEKLQAHLDARKVTYEFADTIVNGTVEAGERAEKVEALLSRIRRARLVVTDRYHGLIFSAVTRTPAVVMRSFDTKIASGIKWFEGSDGICYADGSEIDEIENFIDGWLDGRLERVHFDGAHLRDLLLDTLKKIVSR